MAPKTRPRGGVLIGSAIGAGATVVATALIDVTGEAAPSAAWRPSIPLRPRRRSPPRRTSSSTTTRRCGGRRLPLRVDGNRVGI